MESKFRPFVSVEILGDSQALSNVFTIGNQIVKRKDVPSKKKKKPYYINVYQL